MEVLKMSYIEELDGFDGHKQNRNGVNHKKQKRK